MKTLSILAILLSFAQCGSNTLVQNPSFKVEKAFYNNWVGGQPGVSGTKLEIHLKNASEVIFDSLYFKNKRTKVEVLQKEEITQIIGHYSTSKRINNDLILAIDPTDSYTRAMRAMINYGDGRYEKALEDIDSLIAENPDGPGFAPLLEIKKRLLEKK